MMLMMLTSSFFAPEVVLVINCALIAWQVAHCKIVAFFRSWNKQTIIRLTSAGPDLRACLHIKVTLLQFFRDSVARATIACQTSVLIARAKMTPVNLRINKNIFST